MSSTPTAARAVSAPMPSAIPGRSVGLAAAVYVGAWIVGLMVNTTQLAADASASDVRTYYIDHASAVLLQATLVHAVAGVALAALTVGLASGVPAGGLRRSIRGAGLAASAISVGQAALAYVAVSLSEGPASGSSMAARQAIGTADSAKLMLLAVLVASVSAAGRRAARMPRWLIATGQVLAVLLVLGAASFVLPLPLLGLPLVLSLALLLVWVASLGALAARHALDFAP